MTTFSGWECDIKIGTSASNMRGETAIAWQSAEFDFKNNCSRTHIGGQRIPEEIKEGLIEVAAKIARWYRAETVLSDRAGVGDTGALTEYWIGIYPEGYASNNIEYMMHGKFDTYKMNAKHDSRTGEESDFMCVDIAVADVA